MKGFTLKVVKKIASALAIMVFLFGVVSVRVQGQDATDSSLKPARTSPLDTLRSKVKERVGTKQESAKEKVELKRSALQEKRAELREKAKEKRAEVKQRISVKRSEKIKEFSIRIKEKLLAMVERMEKLAERLQSRMNKLAEKGADTAAAQTQLDDAKAKLAAVKTRISDLRGVGADITSSDNPKELFSAVKEEVHAIKKDLVEVHRLLASSMGKIKGVR